MLKKAFTRGLYSLAFGTTSGVLLGLIMSFVEGDKYVVISKYLNKLNSPIRAFAIQCLLIGIVSMSFGLFTIVFEKEKWSILKQWILYFIFTTIVWIPISIFCWGYYNLPTTITVTVSYLIGYAITAFIQYKNCKESVDKINERLKELKEEGE